MAQFYVTYVGATAGKVVGSATVANAIHVIVHQRFKRRLK